MGNNSLATSNSQKIAANPTRTLQFCPTATPYLQSKVCIACPAGQLYNITSQECVSGCPNQWAYDQSISNCVKGNMLTNPSSANILTPTTKYSSWLTNLASQKNSSITQLYCPPSEPYASNGNCISCPSLFNVETGVCDQCGEGRTYDSTLYVCRGTYSDSMSVYRMVSNVI